MTVNFKVKRLKVSEKFFFVGLFLWILQSYMIQTDFLKFYGYFPCTIVRVTSLSIFLFKIIFIDKKYSKMILSLSIVYLVISVMIEFTTTETTIDTFLNVFIIIMAARNIPFQKITNFVFVISGLGFLITVSAAFLGILNNSALIMGGKKRYYLGFDYVSFAPIYLVNIIFCGFYSYTTKKGKSVPWMYIIVALFADILIYLLTSTRLAFGVVLIFICLYIIIEKLHMPIFKERWITKILSVILFPTIGILTCWFSNLYVPNNAKWIALNKLLSNRLLLNKRALMLYDINWFGQVIEVNTNLNAGIDDYMYIDSGYMNLLLQYGVIAFVVVLLLYSFILRNSVKRGNNVLTIWLFCICIYNIVNGMLLSPATNSSLFAVWMFTTELKKRKKRWKLK